MENARNITFEPGYMTLTDEGGRMTKYPIAPVLRAADIPDLTIDSLTLLTTLSQVVAVLVQTLVDKEVIGEELFDGYDLQYVYEKLEDDLAAELS